jgi:hypothetical protein
MANAYAVFGDDWICLFVCFLSFWSLEMIDYIYYLLLQSDVTLGLRQPEADGVRVWRGAVKLRVSDRGM